MLANDSDNSEPPIGAPEPIEMPGCHWSQAGLASHDFEGDLSDSADDREGGDINDEPHDPEAFSI